MPGDEVFAQNHGGHKFFGVFHGVLTAGKQRRRSGGGEHRVPTLLERVIV